MDVQPEQRRIPYRNLREYLRLHRNNITSLVDRLEDERITETDLEKELPQAFKSMHECLSNILIENRIIKSEEEKLGPRIEIIISALVRL